MSARDRDAFEWRCLRCAAAEEDREALYLAGFQAGRESALSAAVPIDDSHLRELLQLCHPDKHHDSALAVRVTAWLNGLREVVR